jgi:4-hydroxythreonine-4-phosphate dehydrogenase
MAKNAFAPLAITMGDPAGIGPEIIVKSFADPASHFWQSALVYADLSVMQGAVAQFCAKAALTVCAIEHADDFAPAPAQLTVLPCSQLVEPIEYAKINASYGSAATQAIEQAVKATMQGKHRAIVTAPIHKEAIALAGIPFPGHTEMLSSWTNTLDVRMMLANNELRTVLVTIHLSLTQAITQITQANVAQTIVITHQALQAIGVAQPRIAVAGLNPHAGESGLFGREELDAIIPAIHQVQAQGINALGPFPGDTIFAKARGFKHFDVVIAMYHDQGLIPVKYLGIEQGVNITLGLPFIRTSVDHGTAFDIAGQGIADHRSLLSAANWALHAIKQNRPT